MVLMYNNRNISDILYTCRDEDNKVAHEDIQLKRQNSLYLSINEHMHHEEYKWWHYATILPWIWKSFIHAKHEAFAFKYDPEIMRHLEQNEMQQITIMMYFWSTMYYLILFVLPFVFKKHYCGGLFYYELYICYGAYAILNAIWEVYIVLRIQNVIRKKY